MLRKMVGGDNGYPMSSGHPGNQLFQYNSDATARHLVENPGTRLSGNDNQHNSSVTSGNETMIAPYPVTSSFSDNLRAEFNRHQTEFTNIIRVQKQHIWRGLKDMQEKQIASFLAAIEKEVAEKLQEKDTQIASLHYKNLELNEKLKQATLEAKVWENKAKFNESTIDLLKNQLQQIILRAEQLKEGYGDSETGEHRRSVLEDHPGYHPGFPKQMICKVCSAKVVSVLLVPCGHLCSCKDCEAFITTCPICGQFKNASVLVNTS